MSKESTSVSDEFGPPPGRLHDAVWRWHFYAAFLVVPFVILQAITGSVYLFKPQLDPLLQDEKYLVEPGAKRVSYDQQLETVQEHSASYQVVAVDLHADPERSTTFLLRPVGEVATEEDVSPLTAYVNPYTGEYLGSIQEKSRISEYAKRIHGTLLLGKTGSVVIELGASWALVMIVTGLFLWWPRKKWRLRGTFVPRWGARGRIFWKDMHKVVGVYLSFFAMFFIVTGLPWAIIWGAGLQRFLSATGQVAPPLAGGESRPHHGPGAGLGPAEAVDHSQHHALSLEEAVQVARSQDLPGLLRVFLPRGGRSVYRVQNLPPRTRDRQILLIDGAEGKVVARRQWSDMPILPRVMNTGIDLHEGRFFGLPNQLLNLAIALSLIWMAGTGVVMWWKRRPRGQLAAPPRVQLEYWPGGVVIIVVVLAFFLPTVGALIILMWLFDRLVAPRVRWLRAATAG